jgi:glycosyltransferase involved in cell wall biosynthesis
MKAGYIKKEDRKKILFIGDDIRFFSGIATVSRELILGTAHTFNYACIGGAMDHPDKNKRLDLSQSTNETANVPDSSVILYPTNGYGNQDMIRQLISIEKPDLLVFITDPRYYEWLFRIEQEIRKTIPMVYINIWDCEPAPLYNKNFYRSCDTLLSISKQTKILNEIVLGEYAKDKIIKYFPHGINENNFYPIRKEHYLYNKLQDFKSNLLGNKQYDFVLLFNSRNIRRKSIPDTILAFRHFLDQLPSEKSDKCCLVLHTHKVDDNGTDLPAVIDLFMGDRREQVIFSDPGAGVEYMNMMYNSSDATILLSSNEGWGLSLTESMMCGRMIIANVTGGMQDQMRFEDEKGNWIEFDESFCTNHLGRYKKCGEWAIPVFPAGISIQGSPPTPYISDDRVDFRDAAKAIMDLYNMGQEERDNRGMVARNWVTSSESMMSARSMSENFTSAIYQTLENWKPRERFHVKKIEERPIKTIKNYISL